MSQWKQILKENHWMTSGGKIKFWRGLLSGPGLFGQLHEYSFGATKEYVKWTTEE